MENQSQFFLRVFIVLTCFLLILLFIKSLEVKHLHRNLIERRIIEYDSQTGELEWNENFNLEIEHKGIENEYED